MYGFSKYKNWKLRTTFQQIKTISKWSRKEINHYQLYKLHRLLTHAQEKVPFYQKRFAENNFSINNFKNIDQLALIPPLTRLDMQYYSGRELIATGYNIANCYHGNSSGSTGQPVHYYRDWHCAMKSDAASFFGQTIGGWNFGKEKLFIWGNPTTVTREWSRLSSKTKATLFSETRIPAYQLQSEEKLMELATLVQKGNFRVIDGYTGSIFSLAKFIRENNLQVPKVECVLTTAETLQAHQKRTIAETLGPVRDYYGCGEIISIAYQCGQDQGFYHIMDPHVIVEFGAVVDNEGNQELLITDLDNYAMPLIRYANGDKGKPNTESCNCSCNFSTLKAISGRISDVIRTPDGGILAVPSFLGSLKEINGIDRYQVELVAKNRLRVNLQVNIEFDEEQHLKFIKVLHQYIPADFKYELHIVDTILPDKKGKYKLVIDRTK